jgi:hypothetical protein
MIQKMPILEQISPGTTLKIIRDHFFYQNNSQRWMRLLLEFLGYIYPLRTGNHPVGVGI